MKKFILFVLSIGISFGALYLLIGGDVEKLSGELSNEIETARFEYLLPTLAVQILALVTRGIRWRALLNYRTSSWHAFNVMNVGYMLMSLPLRVGEVARAWMTTRLDPPIQFFTSISSIVLERVLDILTVMILLAIALVLLPVPPEVTSAGVAIGVVTLVGALVLAFFSRNHEKAHALLGFFMKRLPFLKRFNLEEWLGHFLDGLEPLNSAKIATEAIFWTAISWGLSVLMGYLLMLVFFPEGDLGGILLVIVLLSVVAAVPSVPGNLGTFEAAGVLGFYLAGMIGSVEAPENAPALAFSLLLHIMTLGLYTLLGLTGLWIEGTNLGQVRRGVSSIGEEHEIRATEAAT